MAPAPVAKGGHKYQAVFVVHICTGLLSPSHAFTLVVCPVFGSSKESRLVGSVGLPVESLSSLSPSFLSPALSQDFLSSIYSLGVSLSAYVLLEFERTVILGIIGYCIQT